MTTMPTSVTFTAIGTTVLLKVTDAGALEDAHTMLRCEIDKLDRTCSRFRDDSDLMRVNRNSGRWTAVDPLLIEALARALRAAELTDGVLDPTVGRALLLAGYDRDWELLERCSSPQPEDVGSELLGLEKESPRARARVRACPSLRAIELSPAQAIELDPERALVRVSPPARLDLGAIAKAWAADRSSNAIHKATGAGVLVSIGGDIAVAGQAPAAGWRIHVTDDHRGGEHAPGQTISIASGGLATSSVSVRCWKQGATAMHHIIDPVTGAPARGPWRTVSVAAAGCEDANIASTATLARTSGGREWLESQGLPARLIAHDGQALRIGEWPEE
jgi:thiamine biosynthesis lipoprotein